MAVSNILLLKSGLEITFTTVTSFEKLTVSAYVLDSVVTYRIHSVATTAALDTNR
jgi:hypothetical protein